MNLEKEVAEYKQYGLVSRNLVQALVEHFEATRKLSICWARDPSLTRWVSDPRISFESSVAVECRFGGTVVTMYVSAYEFPLDEQRKHMLEWALKMRCLQEYVKDLFLEVRVL